MKLYCCNCKKTVIAKKKDARVSYYSCDCGCYVGTKNGRAPLLIPTHKMRHINNTVQLRIKAFVELRYAKYGDCSGRITGKLGHSYRTSDIKSDLEAQISLFAINQMIIELPKAKQEKLLAKIKQLGGKIDDISAEQTVDMYCCGCGEVKPVRLKTGAELYRKTTHTFHHMYFWQCECGLHVGCHKSSNGVVMPLGSIPTDELRKARKHIHAKLDPIWQQNYLNRTAVYRMMSEFLAVEDYHTGELRTIEEAREAYKAVNRIFATLTPNQQAVVMSEMVKNQPK